jgi:hypothetical protein
VFCPECSPLMAGFVDLPACGIKHFVRFAKTSNPRASGRPDKTCQLSRLWPTCLVLRASYLQNGRFAFRD